MKTNARVTSRIVSMVVVAGVSLLMVQAARAQEPVSTAAVPSNAVPAAVTNQPLAPAAVTNQPLVPAVVAVAPAPVAATARGNWRIGTRILNDSLQDRHRGTEFNNSFVGTLTQLNNKQDDVPDKFFAQGRIMDWPVWIGVSYDRVQAQSWEGNRPAGIPGNTDGNVDLKGFIPYVQGEWANASCFTPYVEVGPCFYKSKFDVDPNWGNHGQRRMDLASTKGVEVAVGTGIRVYKNLSADLYARYTRINDVTGTFFDNGDNQGDVVFTMSYVAVGAGVTYQF